MKNGLSITLSGLFANIIQSIRKIVTFTGKPNPILIAGFVDGKGCFYRKISRKTSHDILINR